MDLGLDGHVALVTGGGRGLGKATARALIAEGARVAILSRNAEALAATAAEIGAYAVPADTRDDDSVRRAVDEVAAHFGRLDVVVNAAAQPASSVTGSPDAPESILAQVDTKALGYLRVARAAAPHLRAAGGGRIVNIAGMNARTTGTVMGSVRNAAVVAVAKNLADELGRDNIAVTVVHPGLTRTERSFTEAQQAASEFNALGRTVDGDEVAAIVTFLASPRAAAANGAVVTADGGRLGSIWG
jgi:NAD(P)-dependent dehydrogenase (short-subunit alcohol dehydrogenase family)